MSQPTTDIHRKRELTLIHLARVQLGLSRADYEHVLDTVTGAISSADLDAAGRDKLIKHFKSKGFVVKPTGKSKQARSLDAPQVRKLRAMWWALADVAAVEKPANALACAKAVEAWAVRQASQGAVGAFSALRFASHHQLNKLIEEMKAWGLRVKADIQ
ncbi:regulatory protein GemA [Rhodoferax sp.]|uniref:regulatory protein GemA n=1 Tax=Rhodoferax sp. TaxID=50421 RepID=UPI002848D33A|nr:regulatory protein GemA [Rhodoferax sp.]MDR3370706.1 regulatory protein GemA [Rhodoferax sp.]